MTLSGLQVRAQHAQHQLDLLLQDSQLKGTRWSVCAIDLTTGDTLASAGANLSLPSASITKLFSTAAVLHELGPTYKAHTDIYIDGPIQNGILKGNVWIIGYGDPSLGSHFFNASGQELAFLETWVQQLKALGIRGIEGQLIADARSFLMEKNPIGWEPIDMGNYYGCGAFGINFYDNTIQLDFSTGPAGTPLKLRSLFPNDSNYRLQIEAKAGAVSGDETFVYGEPYDAHRTIKGLLPAQRASFVVKASMPDPERLLAQLFYEKLQASGVRVDGGPISRSPFSSTLLRTDQARLVYREEGRSLEEIVFWTNQKSVNLFAESAVKLMGYERYGLGSYANGLKVMDSLLQTWNIRPAALVDGSGLSKMNATSAADYVKLLAQQTQETYFPIYYKSLPIAGQSGTLKNLCKGQVGEGHIHAKSGSIRGIKSYAGYVELANGHQIVFAIIANDFVGSGAALSKKMEPFLNALVTDQARPK
ncbi:MAG: hypothetical protein RLZZ301_327 [Bacteroidota bacterium]